MEVEEFDKNTVNTTNERNVIVNNPTNPTLLPTITSVSPAINTKTLSNDQIDLQMHDINRIDVLSITEVDC